MVLSYYHVSNILLMFCTGEYILIYDITTSFLFLPSGQIYFFFAWLRYTKGIADMRDFSCYLSKGIFSCWNVILGVFHRLLV
jgi:hypothetical protein